MYVRLIVNVEIDRGLSSLYMYMEKKNLESRFNGIRIISIKFSVLPLVATKGDALADEYEDELGEGRGVGARRGAFLSTSGSFTLSSGGSNRAGNSEEMHEF